MCEIDIYRSRTMHSKNAVFSHDSFCSRMLDLQELMPKLFSLLHRRIVHSKSLSWPNLLLQYLTKRDYRCVLRERKFQPHIRSSLKF